MLLGIDVGGTHTDAVLISETGIAASCKVRTEHANLLSSIRAVLEKILEDVDGREIERLNLSTTLSTNAIVEERTEPVGLFVSAGPGVDPALYRVCEHYYVVKGSIDHRGVETLALDMQAVERGYQECAADKVKIFAAVGKFSPRNPAHENAVKEFVHPVADFVTLGHEFSGQLNFGRRVATAYFNSAVWRIYNRFADAVQQSVFAMGLRPQINVLKADGGTMPLSSSRFFPVESIFSGPAASVMGIIAICDIQEDSIILDIGGTTTDIAIFAAGAPLVENEGITISDQPTLVRALRTRSIGIGGDSAINVDGERVSVGPRRLGPSLAHGGKHPALVDALNVQNVISFGDAKASYAGLAELAAKHGFEPEVLADYAISYAVNKIREEVALFVHEINDSPVYTIFELLEGRRVAPRKVFVMGGPAMAFSKLLQEAFSERVILPKNYSVANAIGAALARPTLTAELFADTQRGRMLIPSLNVSRRVGRDYDLARAERDAEAHLREYLRYIKVEDEDAPVQTVHASSFNMIEDGSTVGANIRVKCQILPGVLPQYQEVVRSQC